GKTYLAVYENGLYVYGMDGKALYPTTDEQKEKSGAIDELMFGEAGATNLIVFSYKPINTTLYDKDDEDAQRETYQQVFKVTVGDTVKEEMIMRRFRRCRCYHRSYRRSRRQTLLFLYLSGK
ncbi:MAG: hypothetical protein MJ072_04620, partial [Clostridia bacterium]|nr:hypothetical protein [Clostridia bacterium]